MNLAIWQQMLIGWGLAFVAMTILWLVQRRTRNAGIVDVGWAAGIGTLAIFFAATADGDPIRRWLVAGMTAFWGYRLAWHLGVRMTRETEDGRYAILREQWGKNYDALLYGFYQIQASWVVLFATPQLIVMHNTAPALNIFDMLAIGIFLVSLIGESIADQQLARFKLDPANKGKVCQVGLWRYSRHPNYFFEWLQWFAYPMMAIGMPWWGAFTVLGPVIMLYFLLKVTGVPLTEKQALRSRGEAYRRYQETTSAFFPMPPRATPASSSGQDAAE